MICSCAGAVVGAFDPGAIRGSSGGVSCAGCSGRIGSRIEGRGGEIVAARHHRHQQFPGFRGGDCSRSNSGGSNGERVGRSGVERQGGPARVSDNSSLRHVASRAVKSQRRGARSPNAPHHYA